MRKKLIDGLYVGSLADCRAVTEQWAVVHACKNPCHAEQCGKEVPRDSPRYLSYQKGTHLYLNIIDPDVPLFQKKTFDDFIAFAREQWSSNRTLLIHCNKGESRAPTLALLFLAKVLHKIRGDTYDAAWLDFEKLAGEPYCPSEGIEVWMRTHWDLIDGGNLLPSLEGAAPVEAKEEPRPELPKDAGSNAEIIRSQPLVHFAGLTTIESKEHQWISPEPNALQFDIDEAYTWCMENSIPCRMIVLKPRQVGCSTKCGHTCYHHMRRFQSDMLVMGDVAKRTEKVYSMFNDISRHDRFANHWGSRYDFNTISGKFTYSDGSEGLVEHDTALDPKAGISGTRQVLWLTEAARYRKVNGLDKKVITAVLNSLANVPKSLAIAESTAEGSNGWYYDTWQGAVTLAQRKQGIVGNGWIKVFAAWHDFAEHNLKRSNSNAEYFSEDLDDRERRGILLYRWTPGQIAWRRMKIKKDCANDLRMFDQDFPEDPESCFLASGRPRFDMGKLATMEIAAKHKEKVDPAKVGTLERSPTGEVAFFEKNDGSSWLWVAERPEIGRRYIAFIDPCTGAQSEGSAFPDAHAPGVWRAGYMDGNVWMKPRLVAAIDVPTGCRWEDALVAERMKAVADWYGDCMIVPETGNGLGVIGALQQEGAYIYEREKMDAMYPGQKVRVAGWDTNSATRPLVVNAIANAVAQDEIVVEYLPMIQEMKTFIINDRGKACAKSGCHDDWVMGPAIGLLCIEYAKMKSAPMRIAGPNVEEVVLTGGLKSSAFS